MIIRIVSSKSNSCPRCSGSLSLGDDQFGTYPPVPHVRPEHRHTTDPGKTGPPVQPHPQRLHPDGSIETGMNETFEDLEHFHSAEPGATD